MLESRKSRASSAGQDGLFGWTVFILFLAAFAVACWYGSFYVFGHPEKAFSYGMLRTLGKLDAPRRFELTAAPRGQFLDADKLYERFGTLTPRELAEANEKLLRGFVRNYHQSKDLVPYVTGDFNIMGAFRLGPENFFGSGVVVLAASKQNPRVFLQLVFPASDKNVPQGERMLQTGLDLNLPKTVDPTALINASIQENGQLHLTAVPILYGNYTSSDASGTFSLEPPADLNVGAGLPVLNQAAVDKAEEHYKTYLARAGLAAPASGALFRIEPTEAVNPETIPVARAAPANTAEAQPADSVPVARAIPVEEVDGVPVARAQPVQPGMALPAEGLQPFAAATPIAVTPDAARQWPVFAPGQMPRGRLLDLDAARALAGGSGDGVNYLAGDFQVTASGQSRVVLRGSRGQQNIRVIVDFPDGSAPPGQGELFTRDAQRPFRITGVEQGADGQINVYAREVTRP